MTMPNNAYPRLQTHTYSRERIVRHCRSCMQVTMTDSLQRDVHRRDDGRDAVGHMEQCGSFIREEIDVGSRNVQQVSGRWIDLDQLCIVACTQR